MWPLIDACTALATLLVLQNTAEFLGLPGVGLAELRHAQQLFHGVLQLPYVFNDLGLIELPFFDKIWLGRGTAKPKIKQQHDEVIISRRFWSAACL